MKKILTVILRNQFNLFYRFGYTYIPKAYCIEFSDIKSDNTQESLIKLFSEIAPFEYDEEYIILHLEKDLNTNNDIYSFDIQDIVSIYPLTQQAKVSIESKIDERIRLEYPIFETLVQKVDCKIVTKEREKALDALWHLCGFDDDVKTYLSNISREY